MLASHRAARSAAALVACLALASCKPPENQNNSQNPSAPPKQQQAASSAAAEFAAPRKATGALQLELITNNASNFWTAMEAGMNAGVKEMGSDVASKRVTPPGAKPTNNDQKQVFEQAIAAGVDGIGVSPIQADTFSPVIDEAIAKKIPVICFDSDADKSKRLAYIGTNNYEAGKRAGEAAVKLFPNGGNFVAFVGMMSAQNARDRYQGFQDAVKGHNINMLQEPFQDNADKTGAAINNVKDAITKYGDKINGFLGIWSYNGPAIVKAVTDAGIRNKVKIVCFDGDPGTLAALQAGNVDASVIQKPYEFGRLSVRLLTLINRKGLAAAMDEMKPELEKAGMKVNGSVIDTGVTVVTPANAKEFIDNLKKLGLETT